MLVGTDTADYAFLDLPEIADEHSGTDALEGICTALAGTGSSHVLVMACDMPFLNVNLLRYLASLDRDYDVLVPVLDQPQPLHAIYSRSCLPLIDERMQAGQYKVT